MFEHVRYGVTSDIGLHRNNNEDHFSMVDPSCCHEDLKRMGIAFVVADGLGGHAAGEIASKTACEEVIAAYYRDGLPAKDTGEIPKRRLQKLEKAIRSAHARIVGLTAEKEEWRGMGTTLSALVLTEKKALIGHVGDSRIYRRRGDAVERLTRDHTKSQALIDMGQLLPGHGSRIGCGHILTKALGGYDDLTEIFTREEELRSGDLFLLSTDGLHGLVTDAEIREILIRDCAPQTACDALVQAAIGKGGDDNITVMVIQM